MDNSSQEALSLPLVCNFLRTKSLVDLETEHGVYARIDGYKFSLNYDQIEAKDGDPLAQECRGLILGTKSGLAPDRTVPVGETVVLARPMNRFFNFGQSGAAEVDLENPNTRIFEKLDGTLCIIYWDTQAAKWCVATRSVPSANLPVDGFGEYTFDSLFREAFQWSPSGDVTPTTFEERFNSFGHRNFTYCFELMTPANQVVVKHENMSVALLAVRNRLTGHEQDFSGVRFEALHLGVPMAKSHQAASMDALVAFVNSRNGNEYEGVVVCQYDPSTGLPRRVKIKGAAYLMASRARTTIGASPRNLLELILLEQIDDLLPILSDDHRVRAENMRADLQAFLHDFMVKYTTIRADLDTLGPMSDHLRRKTLARALGQADVWMSPAMALYEGKVSTLHDWILKHKDRTNDKRFPSGFLDTLCKLIDRTERGKARAGK